MRWHAEKPPRLCRGSSERGYPPQAGGPNPAVLPCCRSCLQLLAQHSVLDPECAFISPRYVQLAPEGIANPRPEQLVRYNLDWALQLYGTLVHEMSHRLVGPHDDPTLTRDSSLGLHDAFYVQATALAHLLDRQHRHQGTAALPLNISEEISLLSITRSLMDEAFVTRPVDRRAYLSKKENLEIGHRSPLKSRRLGVL